MNCFDLSGRVRLPEAGNRPQGAPPGFLEAPPRFGARGIRKEKSRLIPVLWLTVFWGIQTGLSQTNVLLLNETVNLSGSYQVDQIVVQGTNGQILLSGDTDITIRGVAGTNQAPAVTGGRLVVQTLHSTTPSGDGSRGYNLSMTALGDIVDGLKVDLSGTLGSTNANGGDGGNFTLMCRGAIHEICMVSADGGYLSKEGGTGGSGGDIFIQADQFAVSWPYDQYAFATDGSGWMGASANGGFGGNEAGGGGAGGDGGSIEVHLRCAVQSAGTRWTADGGVAKGSKSGTLFAGGDGGSILVQAGAMLVVDYGLGWWYSAQGGGSVDNSGNVAGTEGGDGGSVDVQAALFLKSALAATNWGGTDVSGGGGGEAGTASVLAAPSTDAQLVAAVGVDRSGVPPGGPFTYTVTAQASEAVTNVMVRLSTPPGAWFVGGGETTYDPTGLLGSSLFVDGTNFCWVLPYLDACTVRQAAFTFDCFYGTPIGTVLTNQFLCTWGPSNSLTNQVRSPVLQTVVVEEFDPSAAFGYQNVPMTGDPVHPGLGNYVCSMPLLCLPGPGMPLSLALTYNSSETNSGTLGQGWTHNYCIQMDWLQENDVGPSAVRIHWADGHCDSFAQDTNGPTFFPYRCHTLVAFSRTNDMSVLWNPLLSTNQWVLTNLQFMTNFVLNKGFVAVQPDGASYFFGNDGTLAAIMDLNSNTFLVSHVPAGPDPSAPYGMVSQVSMAGVPGRTLNFNYDTNGFLISAALGPPINQTAFFQYDAASNLAAVVNLRGVTTGFTYDRQHRLVTEIDGRGNVAVSNSYDDQGRLIAQSNAEGQTTHYAYVTNDPSCWLRVDITAPSGAPASHYYDNAYDILGIRDTGGFQAGFGSDSHGWRVRATDKLGRSGVFAYDTSGNATSRVDRLGAREVLAFGAYGRVTQVRNGLGETTQFAHDDQGNLTGLTDPMGGQIALAPDARGLPASLTDPLGHSWQFGYDGAGQVVALTDPMSQTITCTYDAYGRLASVSQPGNASASVQMEYDANGNLTRQVDYLGNETRLAYDGNDNLVSRTFVPWNATNTYQYNRLNQLTNIIDSLGGQRRFDYDGAGRLVADTDADGVQAQNGYDARGYVAWQRDGAGQFTAYCHDANGNVAALTNALGRVWTFAYDAEDRLIEIRSPQGAAQQFQRDKLGRVIAVTDELGRTARVRFDAVGRMIAAIAPDGGLTSYQYDTNSNLQGLTTPLNQSWTMTYDPLNRLSSRQAPDGRTELYERNSRGLVTQRTTPDGKVFTYDYDLNGHLQRLTLPGGTAAITYAYDAAGNLAAISNGVQGISMAYDKLGRRTGLTNASGRTLGFAYSPAGRRTAVSYLGGAFVVHYAYDSAGRLSTVTDSAGRQVVYAYDALGRVSSVTLPNKTKRQHGYDADNRLVLLSHEAPDGSVLASHSYTYNAAGQLLSRQQTTAGVLPALTARAETAQYDPVNRLLTRTDGTTTNLYAYDARGRLAQQSQGGLQTQYAYDDLDRLVGTSNATQQVAYTYDALGTRLTKTVNGQTRSYLADEAATYCEFDGAGNLSRLYVHAGSLCYSVDTLSNGGKLRVYHGDERGSVEAITDQGGLLVQSYAYNPYGETTAQGTGEDNEFQYLGQHGALTDENGLVQMHARFYDPQTGTFLTEDPLGPEARPGLYAYAGGDPVNRIDPSGLQAAGYPQVFQNVLNRTLAGYEGNVDQWAAMMGKSTSVNAFADSGRYLPADEFWGPLGAPPSWIDKNMVSDMYAKGQAGTMMNTVGQQVGEDVPIGWQGFYNYNEMAPQAMNSARFVNQPLTFFQSLRSSVVETGQSITRNAREALAALQSQGQALLAFGSMPVGTYLATYGVSGAIVGGIVVAADGTVFYFGTRYVAEQSGLDPAVQDIMSVLFPPTENPLDPKAFHDYELLKRQRALCDRIDQQLKRMNAGALNP